MHHTNRYRKEYNFESYKTMQNVLAKSNIVCKQGILFKFQISIVERKSESGIEGESTSSALILLKSALLKCNVLGTQKKPCC